MMGWIGYALTGFLGAVLVWLHFSWRRRHGELQRALAHQQQAREDLQRLHSQEAAERQAQQQALFDSMAEGVLVLDAGGRIELVNRSLEHLLRVTTDVRGLTILEAFRLQPLAQVVERLHKERSVRGSEFELPGVEDRWLEVNAAAVLNSAGVQRGAILVFHDLTRLKQLENTRKEFVANVSHELRTPLSLIKGFVETLTEGAKDDPELAARFLQTIEKHTDRLTYLIEDLLTISRLESGQTVMNFQRVDLRAQAQRAIDDLESRAAEKRVRVRNEVPADLSAWADAERLQQVWFNLVENAIKYGPAETEVNLGARRLSEPKVEVWVSDDGPGIPDEARERIFERFYRVDRARSRESGGTGLGLAIVKHIVQAHGGEVRVESEPGKGATFFFALPTV